MPKYICNKCDSTGYSKNIHSRSFFNDDQRAGLYSNLIKIKTEKKENGFRQIVLTLPFLDSPEDANRSDEELEIDAFKLIQEIDPTQLKPLVCNHNWELVPNTGDEL